MTPKKAIIIVLILFLFTATIFVFLYINSLPAAKQTVKKLPADIGPVASSTGQIKLSPIEQKVKAIEDKTNQLVEQIVEQGRTSTGGVTVEAQSKIDEAVNQEIIEKMKLRTPEQLKADEQRRIDQEKLDQQINQQIKDQLQNK